MIRNVSSSSACEHSGSDVTRWPLAGHWLPETLPSPQRVVHEAPTGAQWSSCCQSDGSVNMPRLLSHTITSKLTSVCCCCSCLVYCTEATSLVCSYTVTQPATIRTISLNIYKHIQRRTRRVYYTHTHADAAPSEQLSVSHGHSNHLHCSSCTANTWIVSSGVVSTIPSHVLSQGNKQRFRG